MCGDRSVAAVIPQAQIDAAARAIHEVTGGSVPFGRQRKGRPPSVTVSCGALAFVALKAANGVVDAP